MGEADTLSNYIRYCIEHGIYKIYDVNCILNEFELPLLG